MLLVGITKIVIQKYYTAMCFYHVLPFQGRNTLLWDTLYNDFASIHSKTQQIYFLCILIIVEECLDQKLWWKTVEIEPK